MVFIHYSYCEEPLCVINYNLLLSDKMVIRNYQEECPCCQKTLDFFWHEISDQIFDEGILD
ncbi:hypothetical protein T472_0201840 [Youngiibacter fragilis 232.1]|uniref:Uncharacterized protein n=1 Tax=Youngiibacter fragilis 232.1 TaxID=994573 RepID=V7IAC3_9CLOT|nr:hypothetical protein T472_0201840 [Youngiibacter fragilis 232.1]